jgi:hypothetical protein
MSVRISKAEEIAKKLEKLRKYHRPSGQPQPLPFTDKILNRVLDSVNGLDSKLDTIIDELKEIRKKQIQGVKKSG